MNRREALTRFAAFLGASPLLRGQAVPKLRGEEPGRIAPLDELINLHEFEPMAQRKLDHAAYEAIAEAPRDGFVRITFRPRMMVNTLGLDLTTKLFGHSMFAPVLVGPIARQKQFHAEGELATAESSSAAQAVMVLADRADVEIEEVAERATAGWWYQVYDSRGDGALAGIKRSMAAGASAVAVTTRDGVLEQEFFKRVRKLVKTPLVVKGMIDPGHAENAIKLGADGIVVSDHGEGTRSTILALPKVAEAVEGRVPLLVDGGFRRGGDVLKALALGATAALIARPVIWGLAAYGPEGAQTAIELIQTEAAKDMTMLGTANIAGIKRNHVRVHSR